MCWSATSTWHEHYNWCIVQRSWTRVVKEEKRYNSKGDYINWSTLHSTLTGDGGSNNDTINSFPSLNSAGHPKGTTEERKWIDRQNYNNCLASICKNYQAELMKDERECLPKNCMDDLIKTKQEEFHVTNAIHKKTLRTCVLRGNLNPQHHGVKSPLVAAEEALVAITIQMWMIRQPLTVNEGIQLMNSFIKKQTYNLR